MEPNLDAHKQAITLLFGASQVHTLQLRGVLNLALDELPPTSFLALLNHLRDEANKFFGWFRWLERRQLQRIDEIINEYTMRCLQRERVPAPPGVIPPTIAALSPPPSPPSLPVDASLVPPSPPAYHEPVKSME